MPPQRSPCSVVGRSSCFRSGGARFSAAAHRSQKSQGRQEIRLTPEVEWLHESRPLFSSRVPEPPVGSSLSSVAWSRDQLTSSKSTYGTFDHQLMVDFDHQPAAGKKGPARLSCSKERRDGVVGRRAALHGAGGCAASFRVRGVRAGDAVWFATHAGWPPDASRGSGLERAPRLVAVAFPTPSSLIT